MPSTHGTVGLACGNGNTIHSSHSGEDLVILEAEQTQDDREDSQDEDCGLSDYETESEDSHSGVTSKETPAPERPLLVVKRTGINCFSTDSDDTSRARLDLEFKKYKDAKKRFLLSLVHDDKSTKCEDEENKLDKVYTLFGDEIIILRDLNEFDPKIRSGSIREKKSKRDGVLRVKSRSRTSSRESTLDALGENSRSRTQSENDYDTKVHGQGRDRGLLTNDANDKSERQEEGSLINDDHEALVDHSQFVEQPSPEQEAERERRAKLRKMYRWERFRFGRFALDAKSLEDESTASTPLSDTKNEFRIPHKPVMTKQKKRETIGDSLFKDDSRKNVCYIDSKDAGIGQHILPIITASNYQQVLMSGQKTPEALKEVVLPAREDSKISHVTSAPAGQGVVVEMKCETEKVASEEEKKSKRDKKKKKRKDSSSSDDLEELERKSEARLGKRK